MKFVEKTKNTEVHHEGKLVYRNYSDFQLIEIFDTEDFGRVLMLDHDVQLTTSDEKIYHTALVAGLATKDNIESVLIVGGGDGGALREVCLRVGPNAKIDVVELDPEVITACRIHLPTLSDGAFDDPRVKVYNHDGFEFMSKTIKRYDVIILDLNDSVNIDLMNITNALKEDGLVIMYLGVGKPDDNMLASLRRIFRETSQYKIVVPSLVFGYTWFSINRL